VTATLTDRPGATAASWWDRVLDSTGDLRAVAVLRIALGPITLWHLRPFLREARAGIAYHDHFWHPFVGWFPELSADAWYAMLWIGAAAAVLMTIGLWTRVAAATAFVVVAGNLLLSTTHFRHNRTFLAILLGGMALLASGRALSVDAWWRRRRGRVVASEGPLWALWLLRAQVALVYLASGISKLVDPDWIGGVVLWDRVVRYRHVLEPTPLPDWAVDLLAERWVHSLLGPAAVATEIFVGIGLWFARTRLVALWVALVFHLMIEISAAVEVFSLAAIAALAIWVTPASGDRVVRLGGAFGGAGPALIRAGDWFGRFRIERDPAGPALAVVDRDGRVLEGRPAAVLVLSRLPLTFLVAGPLLAWRRRGGGG
jgi:uncharacterized membrane protein YphA (DoxX/SURF4 family)